MTEIHIDSSCLPRVQEVCRDFAVLEDSALAYCLQEQEIELHYASNIQKNQLVQNDLRMAKRLQDQEVEAQKLQDSRQLKDSQERDPENSRAVQKDLQRKSGKDDPKKKAEDQEKVKRFHNREKDESGQPKPRPSRGTRDGTPEPLHWEMARLELQIQQQFQEDEELAQKLQEEEEQEQTRIRARRNREQDDDYRAAQVAQDEEIARYLQDKELQTHWGSPRQERQQAQPPRRPAGQGDCSPEKDSWQSGRSPPRPRIQTQESPDVTVTVASIEKNFAEILLKFWIQLFKPLKWERLPMGRIRAQKPPAQPPWPRRTRPSTTRRGWQPLSLSPPPNDSQTRWAARNPATRRKAADSSEAPVSSILSLSLAVLPSSGMVPFSPLGGGRIPKLPPPFSRFTSKLSTGLGRVSISFLLFQVLTLIPGEIQQAIRKKRLQLKKIIIIPISESPIEKWTFQRGRLLSRSPK